MNNQILFEKYLLGNGPLSGGPVKSPKSPFIRGTVAKRVFLYF